MQEVHVSQTAWQESNLQPDQTCTHTINKLLLGSRDDATEVGAVLSTVLLCILPSVSVCEVPVGERPGKQI